MNIDVHGHIAVEPLLRSSQHPEHWRYAPVETSTGRMLQRGDGKNSIPALHEPIDLPKVIDHLDAVRVDLMAVSIIPPLMFYELDEESGGMASRLGNEGIAAAVAAYPGRLVGLGSLPMQNVDLAIRELDRLMQIPGMKGVQLGSNVKGDYLGAVRFWPLWEAIQELEALVFVHPVNVIGGDRLSEYFLSNLIGNPVETARCIADVVFSGLLEKYPRLKIVFAHGGGAAPFLWGRWDHGYKWRKEARAKIQRPPGEYIRLLYFDTITHSPAALKYLVAQAGADHVVLGSDYPFDMGPEEPVGFVENTPGLSVQDKSKILSETAARLLSLDEKEKS